MRMVVAAMMVMAYGLPCVVAVGDERFLLL